MIQAKALTNALINVSLIIAVLPGCDPNELETELASKGETAPQKIVNGTLTGYTEWKGAVGIKDLAMKTICTGTLVDPQAVLTAAHCVMYANPDTLRVFGGPYMNALISTVETFDFHPDFDLEFMTDDIALIKLSTTVTAIECYGLRDIDNPQIGESGWFVGYGTTSMDDPSTARRHRKGQAQVKNLDWGGAIMELGDPAGTCQGDSGGPFFSDQDGYWVVTGITSFGMNKEACSATEDTWATSVYHFRDWVDETLETFVGHGLDATGCAVAAQGDADTDSDIDSETDTDTVTSTDTETATDIDTAPDTETDYDGGVDAGETGDDSCGCSIPGRTVEVASTVTLLASLLIPHETAGSPPR